MAFSLADDSACDDGASEEEHGKFGKPPVAQWDDMADKLTDDRHFCEGCMNIFKDCDAELARPRHDAKHHNHEGKCENEEDELLLFCKHGIFAHVGGICHKMLLVFGLMVIDNGLFRVSLDLFCIIHNENAAESNRNHENDKTEHKAVTDGNIGKA